MPAQYPEPEEMNRRKAEDIVYTDPEKLIVTDRRVLGHVVLPTALRAQKVSAQVLRLARRLGKEPEQLAEEIPPETMRRTRYPVIEQVKDDGSRVFVHDRGISEGILPNLAGDKGSPDSERTPAPRERDPNTGKFL